MLDSPRHNPDRLAPTLNPDGPAMAQNARASWQTIAALIGLAAVLRVLHLGRWSLWFDEAATWWNATRPTFADTVFSEVNHGPVWWVITRLSIAAFGDGEAALRAPAALCGILSVGLAYALACRLAAGLPGASGIALLTGAIAALGGFWIEYAQEARMYTLLLAEALGLSLLLLRWIDGRRTRDLVAYALLAVLALYTHVLAVWPLLGHAAYAVVLALRRDTPRRGALVVSLAIAQAAAVALYLPWLLRALAHPTGLAGAGERFGPLSRLGYSLWRIGVGPALAPIDAVRIEAGTTAYFVANGPLIAATAIVWFGAIGLGAWRAAQEPRLRAFVGTAVLLPIAGILALQAQVPLMHEKYLIFLAPFLVFLAALGARSARGPLRAVLTFALVAVATAGALAYHAPGATPGKESWREVHAKVVREARSGAVVVLYPGYLDRAWDYYDRGALPAVGYTWPPADREELLRVAPALRDAPVAFGVFAHDDAAARERFVQAMAPVFGGDATALREEMELFPAQFGIRLLQVRRRVAAPPPADSSAGPAVLREPPKVRIPARERPGR